MYSLYLITFSSVACVLIGVLYKHLHLFDAFSIPLVIHGSVYFRFQDILISHLGANLSIQLFNTLQKVSKFSLQSSLLSRLFQSLDFNSAFIFASLVSFKDLISTFKGFCLAFWSALSALLRADGH